MQAAVAMKRSKEASCSFLKKSTKKLLLVGIRTEHGGRTNSQKFFGSFFQKRTACFLSFAARLPQCR
jgi:hypothetical protein